MHEFSCCSTCSSVQFSRSLPVEGCLRQWFAAEAVSTLPERPRLQGGRLPLGEASRLPGSDAVGHRGRGGPPPPHPRPSRKRSTNRTDSLREATMLVSLFLSPSLTLESVGRSAGWMVGRLVLYITQRVQIRKIKVTLLLQYCCPCACAQGRAVAWGGGARGRLRRRGGLASYVCICMYMYVYVYV